MMRGFIVTTALTSIATATAPPSHMTPKPIKRIDLGPRPGFLVDDMDDSPLKTHLSECLDNGDPIKPSTLSIAHRGGATLSMPEHTLENTMAGARMGAGILECDVAFTSDLELVCRHSQCDLHYTTDILQRPELAAKCTTPFMPADVEGGAPAEAKCCTSDITLKEFSSLCGIMESRMNDDAASVEEFLSVVGWRTELYATCGTVMSLREHIDVTTSLGLLHTPELKTPEVAMPFRGSGDSCYTQEDYAQQLVDEYRDAGVPFEDVYPQSFLYDDILYWLDQEPEFASHAMFLDSYGETAETLPDAVANLTTYARDGLKYLAPPVPYLVTADEDGTMAPSEYANKAKDLGFKIVPWTLERSGPLVDVRENGDYYYMYFADAVNNDGDVYDLVDLLVRDIGIVGLFSDWAATVTFYANCMGIGLHGERP